MIVYNETGNSLLVHVPVSVPVFRRFRERGREREREDAFPKTVMYPMNASYHLEVLSLHSFRLIVIPL